MSFSQGWALILVSILILYGLWMLLDFLFGQIERYHAACRNRAAEPRNNGVEQAEGKAR